MEATLVKTSRLNEKNKWIYDAHSQFSLQVEGQLRNTSYKVRTLGTVVLEIADGLHGVRNYVDEGVPLLAVGNITDDGLDLSEKKMITREEHERLDRSQVQKGDMLVTITGRLGTTVIYNLDEPANLSAHVARVKVNEDAINPHYLAVYLKSDIGQQLINEFAIGSIYPHINVNKLQRVRVVVPPRPLQDRIAQIMQDAYATRQAKLTQAQQLLDGLDDFVLSELNIDLGELESRRTAVKSIRTIAGGRFDFEAVVTVENLDFNGTEPTSLNQVVQKINDRVTPAEALPDESINYVGLGNIESNTGQLTEFAPTPGSQILSSSPTFKQGDILYGRMRPYLNKVWIAKFDGICSGEAIVLRPDNDKVDVRFLHALLLSKITLNQVIPLQSGTSLPRVSASDVLSVRLPISTDLNQQKNIGNEIERIHKQAKQLSLEAENIVAKAKARVERLILGEEA